MKKLSLILTLLFIISNGLFAQKLNEKVGNSETENTEKTDRKDNDSSNVKVTQLSVKSYSRFDFVPGEKVIFFDDFAQDAIGDFPALWNTNGSGEVQTTNLYPGKWLGMKSRSDLMPETKLALRENYTIEFDAIMGTDADNTMNEHLTFMLLKTDPGWKMGSFEENCTVIDFNTHDISGFSRNASQEFFNVPAKEVNVFDKDHDYSKPVHVSLWIQNQRLRCYVNENKVLDLPKLIPPATVYNALLYRFEYDGPGVPMISNVRIAQGLPDMRSKLITEGKLVSYGIYFDVNKAEVKPESYGTLKELAQVLTENPGVRVKVIGHTDGDGDDTKNLDLSKRRGEAVKATLVKDFGIDASRLESDGMGETKPVAPNDTPANKALNRRVEFVRQ